MGIQPGRLWRTVRHLRPVQIYGRAWFRLKRIRPDLAAAPALRKPGGAWIAVPARAASMTGPACFRFLNAEHCLDEVGWDDPAVAKLWRYNLHYFDDLQSEGWQARTAWHHDLVAAWIAGNPPGQGSGWEPYPLSLRIVNWCKWWLSGQVPSAAARQSLAFQVRALAKRMEWHLLGNHLFANAKALVIAGHVFDGPEAAGWRARGLTVLRRELNEQFLPDGGHFELSPMYHALALEDLLDLLNVAGAHPGLLPDDIRQSLRDRAQAAVTWLDRLSHPDGAIAFFNDAAFGIAPDNAQLLDYAVALGLEIPISFGGLIPLVSGYTRMATGPAVLLADLAPVGPDYLPGHAHADTLSFELSVFGQRIFVNSGVGEYGAGPERLRQRGTAAHNTVVIDGANSSEVWGSFRVGRRARIIHVDHTEQDGVLMAEGAHDGYIHLPGRPVHRRRIVLTDRNLVIEDRLEEAKGSCGRLAAARFHLHPAINVHDTGQDMNLSMPDGRRMTVRSTGGVLRREAATWHPQFGQNAPTSCLVLTLDNGQARFELAWS